MKRVLFIVSMVIGMVTILSSFVDDDKTFDGLSFDTLRKIYSGPTSGWPKPFVDSNIVYHELGVLPKSPLDMKNDTLRRLVELGKKLFFDPRLSGSNQISCGTCHVPSMQWTDGRQVALGHDHKTGMRNTPGLNNIWASKFLFWDGRASSLEEQASGPLTSDIEMHQDMGKLVGKINKIKGYRMLFDSIYGTNKITNDKILHAIATYERSLVGRMSDFDYFLKGDKTRLTDRQLSGLHLFRTKARCVNCHNGPLFTDHDFHNVGLTYYGRKFEDLGRYNVTKKKEDIGKFKTPSLRDVMRTRPWFHNGLFDNMDGVLNMYNNGMPRPRPRPEFANDPLFPNTSEHLVKLSLTQREKEDIIAFLEAITSAPWTIRQPELPQ